MAITIGTCHFVSKAAAINYYKSQEHDMASVDQKIRESEIVIGRPEVPHGYDLRVNDEGRYVLVDDMPGENRRLYDEMIQLGFSWHSGSRYAHFINAAGKYEPFPVGYITGPSRAEENGNGKPWYISVNGPDGWHQKSGTVADIGRLKAWAVQTQSEILAKEQSSAS